MEMNDKNNKIKNMLNNKCIENHIADMLENILIDENKSEVDISLLSENLSQNQAEDFNNEKAKRNYIHEDQDYFPKNFNIKNNYMNLNTHNNEEYPKLNIFVNAPETENDFMQNDIICNNNFLYNHNNNNNKNNNYINNNNNNRNLNHNHNSINTFTNNNSMNNMNNLMNINNFQSNYKMQMIPGINNLSPISKNIMNNSNPHPNNNNFNNQFEEEFNKPNKMQKNRLHINYVGAQNINQNYYNSRNTNNNNNKSNSPIEIKNNNFNYINSKNNNKILSISPRDLDNNNNIRINSPRLSFNDNNNISTSNIR
jgi:hypothetical protein